MVRTQLFYDLIKGAKFSRRRPWQPEYHQVGEHHESPLFPGIRVIPDSLWAAWRHRAADPDHCCSGNCFSVNS